MLRAKLKVPIESRDSSGHVYQPGDEGAFLESIGPRAYLIEMCVTDRSLEGDAWYEVLEVRDTEVEIFGNGLGDRDRLLVKNTIQWVVDKCLTDRVRPEAILAIMEDDGSRCVNASEMVFDWLIGMAEDGQSYFDEINLTITKRKPKLSIVTCDD